MVAGAPPYNLIYFRTGFGLLWLLFRKQPRTGKDRGSGRRFELRNPSGRENGAKILEFVGRRSRYHSPFVSHRCDKSPVTSYQPRVATLSPGRPMCSSSPLCHTKELRNNDFQNMLFDNHGSILPPSLFPLLTDNGAIKPIFSYREPKGP